jgi:hypothetical protein
LKELDYDIINYDAGDVRNKALIDNITSNNVSNRNVLDLMSKKTKKIVILMDEIDGMNNGDKGGITALIKIIRQKKTKKQRLENMTMNPIICIGNYYIDKKIKELMKVCYTFELKSPTNQQMGSLLDTILPNVKINDYTPLHISTEQTISQSPIKNLTQVGGLNMQRCKNTILNYIQGDMRKLEFVKKILSNKPDILNEEIIETIFHKKSYNEDSKKITSTLINNPIKMEEHNRFMNETDRTIVALLWHENIVDAISSKPNQLSISFYLKILNNMCFADYIDRITFQSQIWQFNEMSSLIKTFHNNKLYHDSFPENKNLFCNEVRFTKVLTKYSTEYNNMLFIYNLSQELEMDKKDLFTLFQEIRLFNGEDFCNNNCNNNDKLCEIEKIFENYNITKLDIKRLYRYLDKNVKKDILVTDDLIDDDE